MGITVGVATLSVRRGWDLDNVSAPIVTAAGDMVTLPALFLATYLVGFEWVTPIIAVLCAVVGDRGARGEPPVDGADPAPHRTRVAAGARARGDRRRRSRA